MSICDYTQSDGIPTEDQARQASSDYIAGDNNLTESEVRDLFDAARNQDPISECVEVTMSICDYTQGDGIPTEDQARQASSDYIAGDNNLTESEVRDLFDAARNQEPISECVSGSGGGGGSTPDVSSLDVSNVSATQTSRGSYDVSASVSNVIESGSGEPLGFTLRFTADGSTEREFDGTLLSGQTINPTFSVSGLSAGTHTLCVDLV